MNTASEAHNGPDFSLPKAITRRLEIQQVRTDSIKTDRSRHVDDPIFQKAMASKSSRRIGSSIGSARLGESSGDNRSYQFEGVASDPRPNGRDETQLLGPLGNTDEIQNIIILEEETPPIGSAVGTPAASQNISVQLRKPAQEEEKQKSKQRRGEQRMNPGPKYKVQQEPTLNPTIRMRRITHPDEPKKMELVPQIKSQVDASDTSRRQRGRPQHLAGLTIQTAAGGPLQSVNGQKAQVYSRNLLHLEKGESGNSRDQGVSAMRIRNQDSVMLGVPQVMPSLQQYSPPYQPSTFMQEPSSIEKLPMLSPRNPQVIQEINQNLSLERLRQVSSVEQMHEAGTSSKKNVLSARGQTQLQGKLVPVQLMVQRNHNSTVTRKGLVGGVVSAKKPSGSSLIQHELASLHNQINTDRQDEGQRGFPNFMQIQKKNINDLPQIKQALRDQQIGKLQSLQRMPYNPDLQDIQIFDQEGRHLKLDDIISTVVAQPGPQAASPTFHSPTTVKRERDASLILSKQQSQRKNSLHQQQTFQQHKLIVQREQQLRKKGTLTKQASGEASAAPSFEGTEGTKKLPNQTPSGQTSFEPQRSAEKHFREKEPEIMGTTPISPGRVAIKMTHIRRNKRSDFLHSKRSSNAVNIPGDPKSNYLQSYVSDTYSDDTFIIREETIVSNNHQTHLNLTKKTVERPSATDKSISHRGPETHKNQQDFILDDSENNRSHQHLMSHRGSMEKANTMDYSNWHDTSSSQIVHPKMAHHDGMELELSSCDSPLQNPILKSMAQRTEAPPKAVLVHQSSQINYGQPGMIDIVQDNDISNAETQKMLDLKTLEHSLEQSRHEELLLRKLKEANYIQFMNYALQARGGVPRFHRQSEREKEMEALRLRTQLQQKGQLSKFELYVLQRLQNGEAHHNEPESKTIDTKKLQVPKKASPLKRGPKVSGRLGQNHSLLGNRMLLNQSKKQPSRVVEPKQATDPSVYFPKTPSVQNLPIAKAPSMEGEGDSKSRLPQMGKGSMSQSIGSNEEPSNSQDNGLASSLLMVQQKQLTRNNGNLRLKKNTSPKMYTPAPYSGLTPPRRSNEERTRRSPANSLEQADLQRYLQFKQQISEEKPSQAANPQIYYENQGQDSTQTIMREDVEGSQTQSLHKKLSIRQGKKLSMPILQLDQPPETVNVSEYQQLDILQQNIYAAQDSSANFTPTSKYDVQTPNQYNSTTKSQSQDSILKHLMSHDRKKDSTAKKIGSKKSQSRAHGGSPWRQHEGDMATINRKAQDPLNRVDHHIAIFSQNISPKASPLASPKKKAEKSKKRQSSSRRQKPSILPSSLNLPAPPLLSPSQQQALSKKMEEAKQAQELLAHKIDNYQFLVSDQLSFQVQQYLSQNPSDQELKGLGSNLSTTMASKDEFSRNPLATKESQNGSPPEKSTTQRVQKIQKYSQEKMNEVAIESLRQSLGISPQVMPKASSTIEKRLLDFQIKEGKHVTIDDIIKKSNAVPSANMSPGNSSSQRSSTLDKDQFLSKEITYLHQMTKINRRQNELQQIKSEIQSKQQILHSYQSPFKQKKGSLQNRIRAREKQQNLQKLLKQIMSIKQEEAIESLRKRQKQEVPASQPVELATHPTPSPQVDEEKRKARNKTQIQTKEKKVKPTILKVSRRKPSVDQIDTSPTKVSLPRKSHPTEESDSPDLPLMKPHWPSQSPNVNIKVRDQLPLREANSGDYKPDSQQATEELIEQELQLQDQYKQLGVSLQQLNEEIRLRIEEENGKMDQREKHVKFNMDTYVSQSPKVFEMKMPNPRSFPARPKPSNKAAQQQRVRQQFMMYDKQSSSGKKSIQLSAKQRPKNTSLNLKNLGLDKHTEKQSQNYYGLQQWKSQ